MIDLETAVQLALNTFSGYPIKGAWDMGDKWFIQPDTGEDPIPGICSVFINKSTGEVKGLFPPRYNGPYPTYDQRVL